jgi:hypothetical protein
MSDIKSIEELAQSGDLAAMLQQHPIETFSVANPSSADTNTHPVEQPQQNIQQEIPVEQPVAQQEVPDLNTSLSMSVAEADTSIPEASTVATANNDSTNDIVIEASLIELESDDDDYTTEKNILRGKPVTKSTENTNRIKELLKNAVVNSLDSINVIPKSTLANNPMAAMNNMNMIHQAHVHVTSPVIALKSGYRAFMSALTNNEKIAVRNISGSVYEQTSKLVNLVYSKVAETSYGSKMSYEEFLRFTAEDDFQTLAFGIYEATFPNKTEYSFRCPHCSTPLKVPLFPKDIIQVVDYKRGQTYVAELLSNYEKGAAFMQESLLNKRIRIQLPDSMFIIELKINSMAEYLEALRFIDSYKGKSTTEMLHVARHIQKMYVPDIAQLESGNIVFIEITDRGQILTELDRLSGDDMKSINKGITGMNNMFRVDYRLPKIKACPGKECGKPVDNVGVDIIQILFTASIGELMGE